VTLAAGARAQELEPRAFSPSPVGTNFVAVSVGTLRGEILFDPTLPITDVDARIGIAALGYGRTFGLAGRQALVTIAIPYAVAHVEGMVAEQARSVHRDGLADVRVKASWNLVGVRAMTPAEFAKAPRRTIFGVSLTIQAPTGQYDRTKLINIGTHRWAVKPEVGVSVPVKRWSFDVYAGAWFFTDNDAFYPGSSVKSQDPLTSLQGHVSYTFKSRAWIAVDGTWYGGGEVTIDENPPSTRFSNTRFGATVSIPVAKRHAVKLAASTGTSARTGTDFDSYLIGWQMTWFDRGP